MNKMKGLGMSRTDVYLQLRTTNLSTESLRFMLGNKNLVWNSGDKENVLWNSEIYRRLWELGHQLQQSDFQRPLSVMKKVCDTWMKHKTYLFGGCGLRLVSQKFLSDSADEVRNDEQFKSEMNITGRSTDQYWNSTLL